MTDIFAGSDIISFYGPEQALADGILVDVASMGATSHHPDGIVREAGLPYRTVLSIGVAALVRPSEAENAEGQDLNGRLWDTLRMAVMMGAYGRAAREANRLGSGSAYYGVIYRIKGRSDRRGGTPTVKLKIGITADIVGEPIITICLPEED